MKKHFIFSVDLNPETCLCVGVVGVAMTSLVLPTGMRFLSYLGFCWICVCDQEGRGPPLPPLAPARSNFPQLVKGLIDCNINRVVIIVMALLFIF